MNWGRSVWYETRVTIKPFMKKNGVFSNINHPWTELPVGGPFSVHLNSLADANRVSLKLYRIICRMIPSLLNKTNIHYTNDYHMSKRILGMWFRRGKNMRNLEEIKTVHKQTADLAYDSVFGNIENYWFSTFLHKFPETKDGNKSYNKLQGLDNYNQEKFKGKTRFFEKFVKGTKSLY